MKRQRTVLGLFLSLCFVSSFSKAEQNQNNLNADTPSNPATLYTLNASYAYRNFKFNSNIPTNFNRSKGHSNLYLVGGNYIPLSSSLSAGLFVFQMDSSMDFQLTQADLTNQTVRNHSLFAHVLKKVQADVFIDLMSGYGKNTVHYATFAPLNSEIGQVGAAKSLGSDWFASIKGIYSHPWRNFVLTGTGGILHGQVNQNHFTYYFISPIPQNEVPELTTQATLLLESAEIAYKLSPAIKPFLTGGLMQVVGYSTSRPLANAISLTTLPEITSKENGFQAGIGLSLKYKQCVLRFEQQYYQRGHTYQSNISLASLRIALG